MDNMQSSSSDDESVLSNSSSSVRRFNSASCRPSAEKQHADKRKRNVVKERMLQMREQENIKRQEEFLAKEERLRQRETEAVEHTIAAERAQLWRGIALFLRSVHAWPVQRAKAIRLERLCTVYFPLVLVKARRWIRRCRAKLALPFVAKPTVSALRTDKMLGLFSESHLLHLIETTTLKYYFPDESVVFMGCEEDEAYFIVRGNAEVVINGSSMCTLGEGAVFGSVGMLSGEPRTATVVVRGVEGALVWVLRRSDFEAFEALHGAATDGSISDAIAQATIARKMVNDLREQNLKRVYGAMLDSSYWVRKFPVFESVPQDFVESILSTAVPCVRKHGDALCSAVATRLQPSVPLTLVARGRLAIYLARGAHVPEGAQAGELLAMSLEGPGLHKVGSSGRTHRDELADALARHLAQTASSAGPAGAIANDVFLGEAEGPLLLNAPLGALGEAGWLRVEGGFRGVDAFQIARSALFQGDVLELETMRRNALAVHRAFMVPPTGKQVQRALFSSVVSALPVLRLLQKQQLSLASCPLRPIVLRAGDALRSDGSGRDDVYLIVSGELEAVVLHPAVPTQQTPALWPELPLVYFEGVNSAAYAKTRVDAFVCPRAAVAALITAQCEAIDCTTEFVDHVAAAFSVKIGRPPPRAAIRKNVISAIKALATNHDQDMCGFSVLSSSDLLSMRLDPAQQSTASRGHRSNNFDSCEQSSDGGVDVMVDSRISSFGSAVVSQHRTKKAPPVVRQPAPPPAHPPSSHHGDAFGGSFGSLRSMTTVLAGAPPTLSPRSVQLQQRLASASPQDDVHSSKVFSSPSTPHTETLSPDPAGTGTRCIGGSSSALTSNRSRVCATPPTSPSSDTPPPHARSALTSRQHAQMISSSSSTSPQKQCMVPKTPPSRGKGVATSPQRRTPQPPHEESVRDVVSPTSPMTPLSCTPPSSKKKAIVVTLHSDHYHRPFRGDLTMSSSSPKQSFNQDRQSPRLEILDDLAFE